MILWFFFSLESQKCVHFSSGKIVKSCTKGKPSAMHHSERWLYHELQNSMNVVCLHISGKK